MIAIEPDTQSYRCLNKNISHLRNVICISKAAWNCKEFRELKLGVKHADSSLINVDGKTMGKSVIVQADRLDDIISKLGINKIDFLKIDAEVASRKFLKAQRIY